MKLNPKLYNQRIAKIEMCTNLELKINLELSDLKERERERERDTWMFVCERVKKKREAGEF